MPDSYDLIVVGELSPAKHCDLALDQRQQALASSDRPSLQHWDDQAGASASSNEALTSPTGSSESSCKCAHRRGCSKQTLT